MNILAQFWKIGSSVCKWNAAQVESVKKLSDPSIKKVSWHVSMGGMKMHPSWMTCHSSKKQILVSPFCLCDAGSNTNLILGSFFHLVCVCLLIVHKIFDCTVHQHVGDRNCMLSTKAVANCSQSFVLVSISMYKQETSI